MPACGMIHISIFTMNVSVIQGILRLLPQKLRGHSVGIIDGRDIWKKPLKWA
jgi:hypothetical protein